MMHQYQTKAGATKGPPLSLFVYMAKTLNPKGGGSTDKPVRPDVSLESHNLTLNREASTMLRTTKAPEATP